MYDCLEFQYLTSDIDCIHPYEASVIITILQARKMRLKELSVQAMGPGRGRGRFRARF